MKIVHHLVDYIFPLRCLSCSEFSSGQAGFCSECWGKMNFISRPYCKICGKNFSLDLGEVGLCAKCSASPPPYDLSRSLLKFDEGSRHLIHAFKYHDKTNMAITFAKLICARFKEDLDDIDIIIPVPMHRLKRLFRMYNQSQILAHQISKILNKRLRSDILIKRLWTKAQTSLTRSQREKNLQGSIVARKASELKGKRILLVDDVMTTGSTILESTKVLKRAGARFVKVVTIART